MTPYEGLPCKCNGTPRSTALPDVRGQGNRKQCISSAINTTGQVRAVNARWAPGTPGEDNRQGQNRLARRHGPASSPVDVSVSTDQLFLEDRHQGAPLQPGKTPPRSVQRNGPALQDTLKHVCEGDSDDSRRRLLGRQAGQASPPGRRQAVGGRSLEASLFLAPTPPLRPPHGDRRRAAEGSRRARGSPPA